MVTTERAQEIYAEDCLAGMRRRLGPGEIDVVVTSPPYNVGAPYSGYNDHRPENEYLDWIEAVGGEIRRVLSDQGSFFINLGGTPQNPWAPWDAAQRLRRHFSLQNQILWVKSIAIPGETQGRGHRGVDLAFGHYRPLQSRRYLHGAHEFIFHFTKNGDVPLDRLAVGVPYQYKSNVARWDASEDRRCRGNVWFVPYKTIQSRNADRPHPATFPVELAELCFKLHGAAKIRRALDPFVGIGSSAVAARKLGLPFIGFEIDSAYAAAAQEATA